MLEWSAQDYVLVVTAVGTVTGVILTAVGTFIANLARLKAGKATEKIDEANVKIDKNTKITEDGLGVAAENAVVAATAAVSTKNSVDAVNQKLNGGVDSIIAHAIEPLYNTLKEQNEALKNHMTQDATDLKEVKDLISEVTEYQHQRNHDILDAMNTQNLKIEIILSLLRDKTN